jgi:hypothetical protein
VEASVSEIHNYPKRPADFEEPLFHGPGSRRALMEHFLKAPWLSRASELAEVGGLASGVPSGFPTSVPASVPGGGTTAVHRREERAYVLARPDGAVYLVRGHGCGVGSGRRYCRTRKRRVLRVIERWREVRGWWSDEGGADLLLFRVELSGGAVVDLALERSSGEWILTGILD